MPSIMKNGQQFGGVPTEVITAWAPNGDKVIVKPTSMQSIADMIYPVGSIYMSANSTSPAILFGGTWTQIQDTFLLAAGSTYTAGDTGGEATHILTTSETPAHTHERGTMNITGSIVPAHSAGVCFLNVTSGTGAFSSGNSVTNNGKVSVSGTFTGDNRIDLNAANGWTGETSSVGGDGAHNNMPPYLVVYVWQRTA